MPRKSAASAASDSTSKNSRTNSRRKGGAGRKKAASKSTKTDAISLLKADHRKVEGLFAEYEKTGEDSAAKRELARTICRELVIHTLLEEEVFYPLCRRNAVENDILDEAQVEHDGAKVIIGDLLNGDPEDHFYDAKVSVLKEYIKHHVAEEEKPRSGIFAQMKKSGVDLDDLGRDIQDLKNTLMTRADRLLERPLETPSLAFENLSSTTEEASMPRNYDDDDDRDYRSRSGNGNRSRNRDDEGRFTSGGRSSQSRSSSYDDEDDDRSSRGGNRGGRGRSEGEGRGWFGDSEGHADAAERGWEHRQGSSRSRSRSSYDDDDDDSRSSRGRGGSQSRSSSSRSSSGGHGGWFGDPEGHSEASRRGRQHRD